VEFNGETFTPGTDLPNRKPIDLMIQVEQAPDRLP
jgi:hypothetical protein